MAAWRGSPAGPTALGRGKVVPTTWTASARRVRGRQVVVLVGAGGGLVIVTLTQDGLEVTTGFSLPIEHLAVGYGGAAPVRGALAAGFQTDGTLLVYNYFASGHFEQHLRRAAADVRRQRGDAGRAPSGSPARPGSFGGAGWSSLPAGPPALRRCSPRAEGAKVLGGSWRGGSGASSTCTETGVRGSIRPRRPRDARSEARRTAPAIGLDGMITLYLLDAEGRRSRCASRQDADPCRSRSSRSGRRPGTSSTAGRRR